MIHNNDWTVATLKQYFDALRREDEKAIVLLSRDINTRLDSLSRNFEDLKISVERFHSTFEGVARKGQSDWLRIITIVTLLISVTVMSLDLAGLFRHP
jgi:Mg2+ and Co2+ transporter CorA